MANFLVKVSTYQLPNPPSSTHVAPALLDTPHDYHIPPPERCRGSAPKEARLCRKTTFIENHLSENLIYVCARVLMYMCACVCAAVW